MKYDKCNNRNRMVDETLDGSFRLANTNIGMDEVTSVGEALTTGIPLIEICNKLQLCNIFNYALAYLPFFRFKCCVLCKHHFIGSDPRVVTFL